jgi:hypothetical protein
MGTQVTAQSMTTFDVDAQGEHVRINVQDQAGEPLHWCCPCTA